MVWILAKEKRVERCEMMDPFRVCVSNSCPALFYMNRIQSSQSPVITHNPGSFRRLTAFLETIGSPLRTSAADSPQWSCNSIQSGLLLVAHYFLFRRVSGDGPERTWNSIVEMTRSSGATGIPAMSAHVIIIRSVSQIFPYGYIVQDLSNGTNPGLRVCQGSPGLHRNSPDAHL